MYANNTSHKRITSLSGIRRIMMLLRISGGRFI